MFKSRRRGFTLAEVLVTVAIVAIVAAVVVPAVTQQVTKADVPAFNSSVNGLRTAITSFVSDVRRIPGQVDHLQSLIATTDYEISTDGDGTNGVPLAPRYTASNVARWRGPYDNTGSTTGTIALGYGWSTTNVLYDSLGYVVVELSKANADSSDANELERAIDAAAVGSNQTGTIRYLIGAAPALNPANTIRLYLMSSAR